MGEKPRLPYEVECLLPSDVVGYINKFIPKTPKRKMSPPVSPQMQKDLKAIQVRKLIGISDMYFYDLEDFLLD